MDVIFESKKERNLEIIILIVCFISCVVVSYLVNNPFLIITNLLLLYIYFNQRLMRYVVKDNGDLWVRGMWGVMYKAVGIYRVIYAPNAKGFYYKSRRLIIVYKSGLRQGSFPINPKEPEELIAVLKERNPALDVQYVGV